MDSNDPRLELDIDSPCQIYSRSASKWFQGIVSKIYIDTTTNQEWLVVKYGTNKSKKIQRLCNDLQAVHEHSEPEPDPSPFIKSQTPMSPDQNEHENGSYGNRKQLLNVPEPEESTTSSYDDFEFDSANNSDTDTDNDGRYNGNNYKSYNNDMFNINFEDEDYIDDPHETYKWESYQYQKPYQQTYGRHDDDIHDHDIDTEDEILFVSNVKGSNFSNSNSNLIKRESVLKRTADYVNIIRNGTKNGIKKKNKVKFGWISLSSPHSQIPPNSNLIPINREEFIIATEMREYKPYGGIYKYNIINKRWDFLFSYPPDIPFEKNGFHRISFDSKSNELWIYGLQKNEYLSGQNSILLKINIKTADYKIIPISRRQSTGLIQQSIILCTMYLYIYSTLSLNCKICELRHLVLFIFALVILEIFIFCTKSDKIYLYIYKDICGICMLMYYYVNCTFLFNYLLIQHKELMHLR